MKTKVIIIDWDEPQWIVYDWSDINMETMIVADFLKSTSFKFCKFNSLLDAWHYVKELREGKDYKDLPLIIVKQDSPLYQLSDHDSMVITNDNDAIEAILRFS